MTTPKAIGKTYQVGDQIGKGAFGKIFRGLNLKTGEVVAIKQFEKSLVETAQMNGILKELEVLPKLVHQNLIKFVESYDIDHNLFFILEFVEGGSLRDAVKNFGTFPESLLVLYLTQVLRGLQFLHDLNIPHRHIKGDNIMLTKDGMCKLSNSGSFPYTIQQIKANPFWSAPEVVDGSSATLRSDIWAIGCCIVELLTGIPPYWDLGAAAAVVKITEDAQPPVPSTVSPDLQDMLKQCFYKDPKKRINSTNLLSHRCLTSIWGTSATTASNSTQSRTRKKASLRAFFSSRGSTSSKTKNSVTRKPLTDLLAVTAPSSSSSSPSTSPVTFHVADKVVKAQHSPLRSRSPSVPSRMAFFGLAEQDKERLAKKETEDKKKVLDWYGSFEEEEKKKIKKTSTSLAPEPKSGALKRFSSVSSYSAKPASGDQSARSKSTGGNEPAVSVGYRKTMERLEGLLRTERDAKRHLALSRIHHKNDLEIMIRKLKTIRENAEQSPWKHQKAVISELDSMLKILQEDLDRNETLLSELDLLEGYDSNNVSPSISPKILRAPSPC
eukprot:TRINITY_DN1031_c0_g1_i3.p1 TRINITY_DN1031_c0_g1~~TRINITY_DN1031_c0_g1_i3.p1  ORF type:complete len:553 (+),score=95.52 TRINITY_DN1031_c0_g1_i3:1868-3526(+)